MCYIQQMEEEPTLSLTIPYQLKIPTQVIPSEIILDVTGMSLKLCKQMLFFSVTTHYQIYIRNGTVLMCHTLILLTSLPTSLRKFRAALSQQGFQQRGNYILFYILSALLKVWL